MSKWNDAFSTSTFVTVFNNINDRLKTDQIKIDLENPQILESYNRLIKAIDYINNVIKSIDPELIPVSSIAELNALVTPFSTNIDTYKENYDSVALEALNSGIDLIIAKINPFQPINREKGVDTYIEDASRFRRLTEEVIEGLKNKVLEINAHITETVNTFNNQVTTATTTFNTTITEMNTRFTQLQASIDAQKVRTDELIANYQTQFSSSEQQRLNSFQVQIGNFSKDSSTKIQEITNESNTLLSNFKKETQDIIASYHKDAAQLINDLEKSKKQASDLVQIISNIGVTGNYNKMANSDRKWAIALRITAIVFMFLLVAGAVYTVHFAITQTNGFDWRLVIFMFLTTFTLAIPAIYAARESEKHRNSEQKYRKMELELASIDPYLGSLPDTERIKLKASFAERVFGQPDIIKDKDGSVKASTIFDMFQKVIETAISKK